MRSQRPPECAGHSAHLASAQRSRVWTLLSPQIDASSQCTGSLMVPNYDQQPKPLPR